METCVICGIAYDHIWDESGKLLINPKTNICYKCQTKFLNHEINFEDYDIDEELLKEIINNS